MPSHEEIAGQENLLAEHRRTLAHYIRQQAQHSTAYAPPMISTGIREARVSINRIKATLRGWNIQIEDHPDDEEQLSQAVIIDTGGGNFVDLSQFLEVFKSQAQGKVRRESRLYKKQSEVFRNLLAIVYRLRNSARDLLIVENISEENIQKYQIIIENLKRFYLMNELYFQLIYFNYRMVSKAQAHQH